MNAALAKNVKVLRKVKHWTQQHLADTADILLRTVQRVEKGDGASLDTLGALASAFDVTIDFLQSDLEALVERGRQEEDDLRRSHYVVEVTPVTCSAHLEAVGGANAYLTQCASEDDAVRDSFCALVASLTDMGDLWHHVDPIQHRTWVKAAYEHVEALNELGVVVSLGRGFRTLSAGKGTLELLTLYVVAWPKGQEKETIAVEREFPAAAGNRP